jgi:hypothetical protein
LWVTLRRKRRTQRPPAAATSRTVAGSGTGLYVRIIVFELAPSESENPVVFTSFSNPPVSIVNLSAAKFRIPPDAFPAE